MSDTPIRLTFEDLWVTPPDVDAAQLAALPRLGDVPPGSPQVYLPDPTPPRTLPVVAGSPRPPRPAAVNLDGLATMPWVSSVVAQAPIELTRPLPQVTELFVPGLFGDEPGERALANLPNLVRVVLPNVRPELLAGHGALRDAYLGWLPPAGPASPAPPAAVAWATEGLAALARLRGLERLRLRWCPPEAVDPLVELTRLRWLAIEGLRNHRRLGELSSLERLEVRGISLASFRPWRRLVRLRRLAAYGRIGALDGIDGMTALEDLAFTTSRVQDLGPLGGLAALRRLWIWTRSLPDLAPLAGLGALEELTLHCGVTPDPAPLAGRLERLRRLELHVAAERPVPPMSLGFLAGHDALEEVVLGGALVSGASLDVLADLPSLRRLTIAGGGEPDLAGFRRRRPDVEVEAWFAEEPAGRVHVGPVHYDPPRGAAREWFIFQSLADDLGTVTNYGAEGLVRAAVRARDPALARRLSWDTEGGAVGISARSEADIRAVAEVIAALVAERDTEG